MVKKILEKKVADLFKEKELYYEWGVYSEGIDKYVIEVVVEWGDWKHDHAYLDWVMNENGFVKTNEVVTEDDGSDCYSAVHTFKVPRGT